jgi:hypothetical protein
MAELAHRAGPGLDAIFGHCVGYPIGGDRFGFLRARTVQPAAKYVNTIGRTVQQIKQEAALRQAIQAFVDSSTQLRGASPFSVRAAIQAFVWREPGLSWARQPAPGPSFQDLLRERAHFATVIGAVVVLSPVVLLGLPVFVFLLRRHEKSDVARDTLPSYAHVMALAQQEDHGVQNPFTSGGLLKPGPFRRLTSSIVLAGTDFLTRHVFNHANLIGVKTIHFGRWLYVDQKRRVLFATSYDGSLENYMDDFIDKIAWGLNIQFSNGLDYPKTDWLVKGGARDEQVFKRFNLNHQVVAPFWYAAYQGITALNIENNAQLRAGLYGQMDESATRRWLRRI